MENLNLEALRETVALARELQQIIQKTPLVGELILQTEREYSSPAVPVLQDTLIFAGQAAKVLHVNVNTIGNFERRGLLRSYLTPNSCRKKYWLSEVKQIAIRRKEDKK